MGTQESNGIEAAPIPVLPRTGRDYLKELENLSGQGLAMVISDKEDARRIYSSVRNLIEHPRSPMAPKGKEFKLRVRTVLGKRHLWLEKRN